MKKFSLCFGSTKKIASCKTWISHKSMGANFLVSSPLFNKKAFCSTSDAQEDPIIIPSLKKGIKKLMRLVHPDLFSNHEKEKKTNEKSLQLLLGYLNGFKSSSNSRGPITPELIELHFFVMEEKSSSTFKEVKLTLEDTGTLFGHHKRLQSMKENIKELFEECGLEVDVQQMEEYADEEMCPEKYRGLDLVGFLMDWAETSRAKLLESLKVEREIGLIRMVLSTKGISVGIQDGDKMSQKRRLYFLSQLPGVLDRVGVNINSISREEMIVGETKEVDKQWSNIKIMIGHGAESVDFLGHIHLPIDNIEKWEEVLKSLNFEKLREMQSVQKERVVRERNIAKLFGIKVVCGETNQVANSHEYRHWLSSLNSKKKRENSLN